MGRWSDWEAQWAICGALVRWWGAGVIGRHSGRWVERGCDGWGAGVRVGVRGDEWGAGVMGRYIGRYVKRGWNGWGAGVIRRHSGQ